MHAHEVLKLAVGDHAKGVREALRALGKRVSLRWVYYLTEPPADVRRLNPYGAFLLLFEALWRAHREGAELLFEHFLSFVAALRDRGGCGDGDLAADLERAEREHSDIVRARFRGDGLDRLHAEIVEDITAKRRLLVTVTRLRAEERSRLGRQAA
jgi:hypothetical protein